MLGTPGTPHPQHPGIPGQPGCLGRPRCLVPARYFRHPRCPTCPGLLGPPGNPYPCVAWVSRGPLWTSAPPSTWGILSPLAPCACQACCPVLGGPVDAGSRAGAAARAARGLCCVVPCRASIGARTCTVSTGSAGQSRRGRGQGWQRCHPRLPGRAGGIGWGERLLQPLRQPALPGSPRHSPMSSCALAGPIPCPPHGAQGSMHPIPCPSRGALCTLAPCSLSTLCPEGSRLQLGDNFTPAPSAPAPAVPPVVHRGVRRVGKGGLCLEHAAALSRGDRRCPTAQRSEGTQASLRTASVGCPTPSAWPGTVGLGAWGESPLCKGPWQSGTSPVLPAPTRSVDEITQLCAPSPSSGSPAAVSAPPLALCRGP